MLHVTLNIKIKKIKKIKIKKYADHRLTEGDFN